MPKKVTVSELVSRFNLEVIRGEDGLNRKITVPDLNRPGLAIAGYFNYYARERVQIIGRTEIAFLNTLPNEVQRERIFQLFQPETPCICVANGQDIPATLADAAEQLSVPLLRSSVVTTILASRITSFLETKLSPSTTIHGVLVDVYGLGMILTGASGIGKSETALELVKRGHRLVADDAVEIHQTADNVLYGNAPDLIKHLLEIRGVGIINVMTLFGAGAVRDEKKITVVVHLETWQEDKQYDRLGIDEVTTKIIDTDVPLVTIPVRPGRNLAVIVEVAAMNFRLKRMGYDAAQQFTNKLTQTIAEDYDDID